MNYADHDATALADLVRRGEASPRELLDEALAALDAVEPRLHATVLRLEERARKEIEGALPDGPFRGVPFVVKDMDGFLAGVPCTMGCRFLRDFVPDHDGEVLRRLRRAGLVFIAKTNCPELGLIGTTEPALHGPTHNPWSLDHSPGGSSGGTAALVAARVVPMGHGGDGGGSLRVPASMCGLFGFKATRGRVPAGPDAGEHWGGYATAGAITRSVRDSAAILDAIAGPEPGAPYAAPAAERPFAEEVGAPPGKLRIAFSTRSLYGQTIHPACRAAVEDAAKLLAELGHEVVEAAPPIDRAKLTRAYLVQMGASTARDIETFAGWMGRKPTPEGFEPLTWMIGQLGRGLAAADLEASRRACHEAGRVMARFHEDHDLFLCSPLGVPPPRIGEWALTQAELLQLAVVRRLPLRVVLSGVLDGFAERGFEMVPNTMLFNQTGQPAMSVPLSWSPEGLPLGVQLSARFGDDATLFRVAAQLEAARPWADRKPPLVRS